MMVIISLILALALLVGIIYALRHHNDRVRQEAVAREQPLPELSGDTSAPGESHRSSPADKAPAVADSDDLPTTPAPASDWRQACQRYRDQGDYEAALSACQQAWPQWQSFEQAARVIRAAIRNTPADAANYRQWLHRLYRLAAQASFLHDKVEGMPEPSRQQLASRFERRQIEDLEMPWQDIGYRDLRLLTKSDRKLLAHILGEPTTHQSARIFHAKQW